MSIQINSASSMQSTAQSSGNRYDNLINNLQATKSRYEEQKDKIKNDDSLDVKTKNDKMKEIDEQITNIQAQIQQAQMDKQKAEVEKAQQKMAEQMQEKEIERQAQSGEDINKGNIILAGSLNALISGGASIDTVHNLQELKTRMPEGADTSKIDNNISKALGKAGESAKKIAEDTEKVNKAVKKHDSNVEDTDEENSNNIDKDEENKPKSNELVNGQLLKVYDEKEDLGKEIDRIG